MSRARGIDTNDASHVEPFPVDDVVASLRRDGVAAGLRLSPATVDQLLNGGSTERLIRDIAHSQRLVAVAQAYLGAPPIVLTSRVFENDAGLAASPSFHFDVDDVLSLTFFVFLSDVDVESGSHQVIAGTHVPKSLRQIWSRQLEEADVRRRFAGRVRCIAGPRGTAWFEDTKAYHRRGRVGRPRKVLSLHYSLRRRAL